MSIAAPNPELLDALRNYAAAHGEFAPMEALKAVAGDDALSDPMLSLTLLSSLRTDCTTSGQGAQERWVMRPSARRKRIGDEKHRGQIADSGGPVAEALHGSGSYAPDRLQALIEAGFDQQALSEHVAVLDRAGPSAPGHMHLANLRSALNHARQVQQTDQTLAKGFFGREDELEALIGWISSPSTQPPLQTVHISGLPGIGKSYLLERLIQMALSTPVDGTSRIDIEPILVRLDFDRSALQVLDPQALFEEISRQMGDALPIYAQDLRQLRLDTAQTSAGLESSKGRDLPRNLLSQMGTIAEASGRSTMIVLDTLEVLRSQGETHVITLFEQLDLLLEFGVPQVSLISAGRGDALDPAPKRVAFPIELGGLEDEAARAMLRKHEVPEAMIQDALQLGKWKADTSNPLRLLLAAKALQSGGFNAEDIPEDAPEKVVNGYLYRAILSRVPKRIRRVANEGLILRRIDVETLLNIIAPALGLTISDDEAHAILSELQDQHWLVDRVGDWTQHRSDIRSDFLDLIYSESPELTADIDRRAIEWFADRDPVAALYHQLQLTRSDGPMPDVTAELAAQFTDAMQDDLPNLARDAVRQARGERSDFGRATGQQYKAGGGSGRGAQGSSAQKMPSLTGPIVWFDPEKRRLVLGTGPIEPPQDSRPVRDLQMMLEDGDLREASYVLSKGYETPVGLNTDAGLIALTHQWRIGQWSTAKRMFDLLPADTLGQAMKSSPHLIGRTFVEMWAEFRFDRFVRLLENNPYGSAIDDVLSQPGPMTMSPGALDFALLCADPEKSGGRFDKTVLEVLHPYTQVNDEDAYIYAQSQGDKRREQLGLGLRPSGGSPSADAAYEAAKIAPHNPYGQALRAFVANAVENDLHPRLLEWLEHMRPRLEQIAMHQAPFLMGADALNSRLASFSRDMVDGLNAMGLTADWSEGIGFGMRLPELPYIAHAAERWRRTVNGLWSYGRRKPLGWTSTQRYDDDTRHRATMFADINAAMDGMRIWLPTGSDEAILKRRLLNRYAAGCMAAETADDPIVAALNVFQSKDIPGTMAAPLAALVARGAQVTDVFRS